MSRGKPGRQMLDKLGALPGIDFHKLSGSGGDACKDRYLKYVVNVQEIN